VAALVVDSALRRCNAVSCALQVSDRVLRRLSPRAFLSRSLRHPSGEDSRLEPRSSRHCAIRIFDGSVKAYSARLREPSRVNLGVHGPEPTTAWCRSLLIWCLLAVLRRGQSSAERAGRKRLRLVGLAAVPIGMASLPAAKPIGADDVGICSAGFLAADVESPNSCSSSSIKWLCLNGPCLERYAQCAPCKAHEASPRPRSTANTAHHTPRYEKTIPRREKRFW
jgi:hypothetical protein